MEVSRTDSKTIESATEVLEGKGKKSLLSRILPFMGPAFIASVAYVDPGNFATNISAGAQLLSPPVGHRGEQSHGDAHSALSAKLGIATGKNLAEHCRLRYNSVVFDSGAHELVAMATDLAEFLARPSASTCCSASRSAAAILTG
jgi:manganese transport protein